MATDFRLTIKDIFTMRRPYLLFFTRTDTVVIGPIEEGTVQVGDTVFAHTTQGIVRATVQSIETEQSAIQEATVGTTVGVRLRGEGLDRIQDGDTLSGSNTAR